MQNTDASGIPVRWSVSRGVASKADSPLSTNSRRSGADRIERPLPLTSRQTKCPGYGPPQRTTCLDCGPSDEITGCAPKRTDIWLVDVTGSAGTPLQAGYKGPLNTATAIHVIQD